MKRFLTAALLAATSLVALPAMAATVSTDMLDDAGFNLLCDGLACETAVAEVRAGRRGPGENELDARNGSIFTNHQTDFDMVAARPYAFSIAYDQASRVLSLGAGRDAGSISTFDRAVLGARFDDTRSLFIRARGENGQATSFTDMVLNGTSLGSLIATDGASYMTVADFDFTRDFQLTGTMAFDFTGYDAPRSRFAGQFKFTDLDVAPVPIPAAGLMALAGLGALGAMRMRARRG